jgi:hypothetical protein
LVEENHSGRQGEEREGSTYIYNRFYFSVGIGIGIARASSGEFFWTYDNYHTAMDVHFRLLDLQTGRSTDRSFARRGVSAFSIGYVYYAYCCPLGYNILDIRLGAAKKTGEEITRHWLPYLLDGVGVLVSVEVRQGVTRCFLTAYAAYLMLDNR